MKTLILNGPNLNLLGARETSIYGHKTLRDIADECDAIGGELGIDVDFRQSNFEGQLVEWIQEAIGTTDAIIINAAAYSHTSIAIYDALQAYPGYKIELHISHPHLRESFRHRSYVSPAAHAVIAGLGSDGYALAIEALRNRWDQD